MKRWYRARRSAAERHSVSPTRAWNENLRKNIEAGEGRRGLAELAGAHAAVIHRRRTAHSDTLGIPRMTCGGVNRDVQTRDSRDDIGNSLTRRRRILCDRLPEQHVLFGR